MGAIYIHAGMAKAGSSSIQKWLTDEAQTLLRSLGIEPLVYRPSADSSKFELIPYEKGSINSTRVLDVPDGQWPGRVENLMADLDRWAARTSILLSSEALSYPFWAGREDFLSALDKLATAHRVRVVYYVRPQHTALEAGWRQWGFRTASVPSEYMSSRSKQLHYDATLDRVRKLAPRVEFKMRPFRRDLLIGNDVVADFASTAFDYELPMKTQATIRENRGLPLQVVNMLRSAPSGWFWDGPDDNARLDVIKGLCTGIAWEDDDATREGRIVLKTYASLTFEQGNRSVIEALQWRTSALIRPDVDLPNAVDLKRLDSLWDYSEVSSEVQLLFRALHASVSQAHPSDI